jgi:hypothetical protein
MKKPTLLIVISLTLISYAVSQSATLPNNYNISATVTAGVIHFNFEFNTPSGYIAIGFGRGMDKVDIISAELFADKTGAVTDRYAPKITFPASDTDQGGKNDILFQSVVPNSGGTTSIIFTRKLVTGDSFDRDLFANNTPIDMEFVWKENSPFAYHGSNKAFYKMTIYSGLVGSVDFTKVTTEEHSTFLQELE